MHYARILALSQLMISVLQIALIVHRRCTHCKKIRRHVVVSVDGKPQFGRIELFVSLPSAADCFLLSLEWRLYSTVHIITAVKSSTWNPQCIRFWHLTILRTITLFVIRRMSQEKPHTLLAYHIIFSFAAFGHFLSLVLEPAQIELLTSYKSLNAYIILLFHLTRLTNVTLC
jgi:hypothetical protein